MSTTTILLLSLQLSMIICMPSPADIDRIFFRDRAIHSRFSSFVCESSLCNQTMQYNEAAIRKAVSKNDKYHYLFGQVVDKQIQIGDRFGNSDDTSNMCPTKSVTMYPREGRNIHQELKTIVNVEGYFQMVTYEECIPHTECYANAAYLPVGVNSFCENNYIIIRLVVINDDNSLGLEKFKIPSGCSCTYSSNDYE